MNFSNRVSILVLLVLVPGITVKAQFATRAQALTATYAFAAPVNYTWEQVLPFGNGSFQEEWKPGTFPLGITPLVALGGNLWMIGQKAAWSSADGITWAHHPKTDWGERISLKCVYFKDKLWMLGGMKYQEKQVVNDLWVSSDGTAWKQVSQAAEWLPRKGHTVVVFRNKLWLLGGAADIQPDFSARKLFNDVWSSTDGIHWTEETGAAPWSPRDSPHVVVFQDALYLLGGQGKADVWRSTDGKAWTPVTAAADWKERYDTGTLVFDNKLWVFGGRDTTANHNTAAKNDVWYSANGIDWNRQTEHAPWTVRSGGQSVVFKANLWLFSGKHTGGKHNWGGDVWTLSATR